MKKLHLLAAALCTVTLLSSCSTEMDPEKNHVLINMNFTLNPDLYTDGGYWKDVYDTEFSWIGIYPMQFTHKAEQTIYDGVTYRSFTGFCPSIVNDNTDHSDDDWTKYQFASIADPDNRGYLIAHWDVRENENTLITERSCVADFGQVARPVSLEVTNTAYAYYVMKNGSAFSRPFGPTDSMTLDIYGWVGGKSVGPVSVSLATAGDIVDKWTLVDLTPLGDVQALYFTMRSTDSGEWGMNTPAYFAIHSITTMYYTY